MARNRKIGYAPFSWREEVLILVLGLVGPWAALIAWCVFVGDFGW